MALTRQEVLDAVYRRSSSRGARFTQDTPVYPDVWSEYALRRAKSLEGKGGKIADGTVELLLTPHSDSGTQALVQQLRERLSAERGIETRQLRLPYNESHVLANLTYSELIRVALPLTNWWSKHLMQLPDGRRIEDIAKWLTSLVGEKGLAELLLEPGKQDEAYSEDLLDFARIAGMVGIAKEIPKQGAKQSDAAFEKAQLAYCRECARWVAGILKDLRLDDIRENLAAGKAPPLWSIFLNRRAHTAVFRSRETIKADAAARVFQISTKDIRWAVIDSGIDATHPAFRRAPGEDLFDKQDKMNTRVVETYDFTRLEEIMGGGFATMKVDPELRDELEKRINAGRPIDWKLLEPLIRIPHTKAEYDQPGNEHGTHVGGIIAANWDNADGQAGFSLKGVCPEIELYDLRVFRDDGTGDEFSVMAALQFVRHLNEHKDRMMVQGVNLSMSLLHDVETFGCGATPVCEECARVTGTGVVCVAAAGNRGWEESRYHDISITDPGNAEDVITVGATHRIMPHKYGVSYFSSRGPTGDGRQKPDIVAPGEKIRSTIPGEKTVTLDGTSMAAPHVSGAAALLMARHRELIGNPRRIKDILCRTATDLGRQRNFQGAGMLDVLRALQSV